jgi:hypothetical protein
MHRDIPKFIVAAGACRVVAFGAKTGNEVRIGLGVRG